jgi:hypothetical protein
MPQIFTCICQDGLFKQSIGPRRTYFAEMVKVVSLHTYDLVRFELIAWPDLIAAGSKYKLPISAKV